MPKQGCHRYQISQDHFSVVLQQICEKAYLLSLTVLSFLAVITLAFSNLLVAHSGSSVLECSAKVRIGLVRRSKKTKKMNQLGESMRVGDRLEDASGSRGTIRYIGPVATSKDASAVYFGALFCRLR